MDLPPAPQRGHEAARDSGPAFPCPRCDLEQVHKISQLLLPGLAAACVDATTGDLFRGPVNVAIDVRKELVEYLTQRSESYVAEFVLGAQEEGSGGVPDGEPPADAKEAELAPDDIVSDLLEDFAGSKRGLLGKVSGWLMSESREDKIDDFALEMEANGFWLADRRETLASTLLKNLDYQNKFHCGMRFDAREQLAAHRVDCSFRPVRCGNEGCKATFCAIHAERHDAACLFKILRCEQNCEQRLPRREMDRHCITVCPMRLVNCPFYQVGCRADAFPQCQIERHCSEDLQSHLLYVLRVIHKHDLTAEELQQQAQMLEESQSRNELSEALDVRSLTLAIKEQEGKMKKLERDVSKVRLEKVIEESDDASTVNKEDGGE